MRSVFVHCTLPLLVAASACSYSPRNNTKLARASDTITWAGADINPNVSYSLAIADGQRVSAANLIANASTAATPTPDKVGGQWYTWRKDLALPATPAVWKYIGSNTNQAKVRTVKTADVWAGTPNPTPLPVFDYGPTADACLQKYDASGGAAQINNCKSTSNGVVSLTAPCGDKKQDCCAVSSDWLKDPRSCNSGLKCSFSGGLGECLVPDGGACAAVGECADGGRCVDGRCRVPKPPGSPCTSMSDCDASAGSCSYGVCTAPAKVQIGGFTKSTNSLKSEIFSDVSGAAAQALFTPNQLEGQSLTTLSFGNDQVRGFNEYVTTWECLPNLSTRLSGAPGREVRATLRTDAFGGTASAAIRYVHGSCSYRADWKEMFFNRFSEIVASVAKQRVEASAPPIGTIDMIRDWDYAQPQFSGSGTNTSWGFFYAAKFTSKWKLGANLATVTTYINPGYAFAPSGDGFVDVRALNAGVIIRNNLEWVADKLEQLKADLQYALQEMAPSTMEEELRSRLELPVATLTAQMGIATLETSCDPGAALSQQQQTCHDQALGLLSSLNATGVIKPENFTCLKSGSNRRQCAFHPIVQQVNVLPEALELVFSPDLKQADRSDGLGVLYRTFDQAMRAKNEKDGKPDGFHMCADPYPTGVQEGVPALTYNGNGVWNTPCGALLQ